MCTEAHASSFMDDFLGLLNEEYRKNMPTYKKNLQSVSPPRPKPADIQDLRIKLSERKNQKIKEQVEEDVKKVA